MKKILSILICICILTFSLVGCGSNTTYSAVEKECRFLVLDEIYDVPDLKEFGMDKNLCTCQILVDKETGVCYAYMNGYHRAVMTVLLDSDGKPLIWSVGEEAE